MAADDMAKPGDRNGSPARAPISDAEPWGRLDPPIWRDASRGRLLPVAAGGPIERSRLEPGGCYVKISVIAARGDGLRGSGRDRRRGAGGSAPFAFLTAEIDAPGAAAAATVGAALLMEAAATPGDPRARLAPPIGGLALGPAAPLTGPLRLEAALAETTHGPTARAALAGAARAFEAAAQAGTSPSGEMIAAGRASLAALAAEQGARPAFYRRERFDQVFAGCYALTALEVDGRRAPMIGGALTLDDARPGARGGAGPVRAELLNAGRAPLPGPWLVIGVEALRIRPDAAALPGPAAAWDALAETIRRGAARHSSTAPGGLATRIEIEALKRGYLRAVETEAGLLARDRQAVVAAVRSLWRARADNLFADGAEGGPDDAALPSDWPSHGELIAEALRRPLWPEPIARGRAAPPEPRHRPSMSTAAAADQVCEVAAGDASGPDGADPDPAVGAVEDLVQAALSEAFDGADPSAFAPLRPAIRALRRAGRLDLTAALVSGLAAGGLETAAAARELAMALSEIAPGSEAAAAATSRALRLAEAERVAAADAVAGDAARSEPTGPWPIGEGRGAARLRAARREEAGIWALIGRAEAARLAARLAMEGAASADRGAARGLSALLGPGGSDAPDDDASVFLDRALAAFERAAALAAGDAPEQRLADSETLGAPQLGDAAALDADRLSLLRIAAQRGIGEVEPRKLEASALDVMRRAAALSAAGRDVDPEPPFAAMEAATTAALALGRANDAQRAAAALALAARDAPAVLARASARLAAFWDRRGGDPISAPTLTMMLAAAPTAALAATDAAALRARLIEARQDTVRRAGGEPFIAPPEPEPRRRRRTELMGRLLGRRPTTSPALAAPDLSLTDQRAGAEATRQAGRALDRAALVGSLLWGGRPIGAGIAAPTKLLAPELPDSARSEIGPWVFLTCAHLVSPDRPSDLPVARPEETRVRFDLLGATIDVAAAVWAAPAHDGHDVAALSFKGGGAALRDVMGPATVEAAQTLALAGDDRARLGAQLRVVGPSWEPIFGAGVAPTSAPSWGAGPLETWGPAGQGRGGDAQGDGQDPSAAADLLWWRAALVGDAASGSAARLQYRAVAVGAAVPAPGAPIFAGPGLDLVGLHRLGPGDPRRGRLASSLGAGSEWARVAEGARLGPALAAMTRDLRLGPGSGAAGAGDPARLAAPAAPLPALYTPPPAFSAADLARLAQIDALIASERGAPLEISAEASALIAEAETDGRAGYERRWSRPRWPGGPTGVVVGIRYDLGWTRADRLEADWIGEIDPVDLALLGAACGRIPDRDGAASVQRLADALQSVEIPWEAALAVFRRVTARRYATFAAEVFSTPRALHPHALGALTSLLMDYGPATAEIAPIRRLIAAGRLDRVAPEIRRLGRGEGGPAAGATPQARRRRSEAELFERGLALGRAAAAPSVEAAALFAERSGADRIERLGAAAREPIEGVAGLSDEIDAPAAATPASSGAVVSTSRRFAADAVALWRQYGAPPVRPAVDAEDVDLAHLEGGPFEDVLDDDPSFVLTAPLLARALRLMGVDVGALIAAARDRAGGRPPAILFGLRGCVAETAELAGDRAAFVDALRLREATVDFRRFSCVIGVWRPDLALLWAGPGSTAPSAPLVYARARAVAAGADGASLRRCNLLPTGVYAFRIGVHGRDLGAPQPGAFVLDDEPAAVIRADSVDPLRFSIRSRWDLSGGWVADNIHAGGFAAAPDLDYLSAGGQVLRGTYLARDGGLAPSDAFARLRLMAGLSHPPQVDDPAAAELYPYALLTGRELRLAAALGPGAEEDPALISLKRGASGPRVAALQRALGFDPAAVDGSFGFDTQAALIRRQLEVEGVATGAVGPRLAKALNLDHDAAQGDDPDANMG